MSGSQELMTGELYGVVIRISTFEDCGSRLLSHTSRCSEWVRVIVVNSRWSTRLPDWIFRRNMCIVRRQTVWHHNCIEWYQNHINKATSRSIRFTKVMGINCEGEHYVRKKINKMHTTGATPFIHRMCVMEAWSSMWVRFDNETHSSGITRGHHRLGCRAIQLHILQCFTVKWYTPGPFS